jgi:hypothetical protein
VVLATRHVMTPLARVWVCAGESGKENNGKWWNYVSEVKVWSNMA